MKKQTPAGCHEEGIDVPYEQLNPETLRTMIEEFVSREIISNEKSP